MKRTDYPIQSLAFDTDTVQRIADDMAWLDGALLPILHAVQERFGYVDDDALPIIAEALNLSRADVQGVVSFYHDFRRAPPRRHVIRVCRAEACQAVGAEALYATVTTAVCDDVTVEPVYCLGICALSPAAVVDGELYGRLNAAVLLDLVRK